MGNARATATRLHCYALISSVETDLRRFLVDNLNLESIGGPFLDHLAEKAGERKARNAPVETSSDIDLGDILDYSDIGDLSQAFRKWSDLLPASESALQQIERAIEDTIPARNRVFHSRPLEPDDFAATVALIECVLQIRDFTFEETRRTRRLLQNHPSEALKFEVPDYWAERSPTFNNLPTPDFDETGFIGRTRERQGLLKHLSGAHPVVSLIGEGGVGKSALALRVLYDLIDPDYEAPFDAVIWVSMKTRVLTTTGIREISSSISDATGILSAIDVELGGGDAAGRDPFAQIAEFLSEIPVLLALDNLETLSDERLRQFLEEVPQKSKVLITSRVAPEVGISLPIAGLDEAEAKRLFYQFAKIMGVSELPRFGDKKIGSFCRKLHFNPLAIKWFIKSLADGAEPARLLQRGGEHFESVLKFCFENVFEGLDDRSRGVLHSLYVLRRQVTSTELSLLLDEDPLEIEWLLKRLHQASLIVRRAPPKSDTEQYVSDTLFYQLSLFAEKYVRKFLAPSATFIKELQEKDKAARASVEQVRVTRAQNSWDVRNIRSNTHNQRLLLPKMLKAVRESRKESYDLALATINEVIDLLPSYGEAYRIKGRICEEAGRLFDAEEAYTAALDVDEDDLSLYHYALFLMKSKEDFESAHNIFKQLESNYSDDFFILGNLGRVEMILGEYISAESRFDEILTKQDSGSQRLRVMTFFQAFENIRRKFEWELGHRDKGAFEKDSKKLLRLIHSASREGALDEQSKQKIQQCIFEMVRGLSKLESDALADDIRAFHSECSGRIALDVASIRGVDVYFTEVCAQEAPKPIGQDDVSEGNGRIRSLLKDKGFGFIETGENRDLFFHKSNVLETFEELKEGDVVSFRLSTNDKGMCAVDVKTQTKADY